MSAWFIYLNTTRLRNDILCVPIRCPAGPLDIHENASERIGSGLSARHGKSDSGVTVSGSEPFHEDSSDDSDFIAEVLFSQFAVCVYQ
jgi:hypothetical protein